MVEDPVQKRPKSIIAAKKQKPAAGAGRGVAILDALAARGAGETRVVTRPFPPRTEREPKLLFPRRQPTLAPADPADAGDPWLADRDQG